MGLHVAEPLFGGYQTDTVRWPAHDYAAAGWTFGTLCTADHVPAFGTVEDSAMRLSEVGRIAEAEILAIPACHPHAVLDAFVVMPDHVHILIGLMDRPDAETSAASEVPVTAEETRRGTSLRAHPPHPTVETRRGASPPTSDPTPTSDPSPTPGRSSTAGSPHGSDPSPTPVHAAPGWIPPAARLVTPRAFGGLTAGSVSSVVNQTKGTVTRAARRAGHAGFRWQPRFHDRVVRSERELDHVRQYIAGNPARWRTA